MAELTTLILKNDLAEVERVASFISALCEQHAVPPELEYDLNLALDEIITNVIKHAHSDGGEHPFTVRVTLSDEEFVAQVEDAGVEFNPTKHPPPDLDSPIEQRRIGGLGIYLVQQIMDSMEYERTAGKNLVTLRKRITSP